MSLDWAREISEFRTQLGVLKDRIETLERECLSGENLLLRRLKGRGLRIHRQNSTENLLIPTNLPSEWVLRFYEMMKRYSFRLFLRDLIQTGDPFRSEELTRYCSSRVAEDYTRFLISTGTVVEEDNQYRLNRPGVSSFGPTLEWFVAQMFHREFASPAIYDLRFVETGVGGDYDVIALWECCLVYVEVKSSPPRGIELKQVTAFFSRIEDLIPDVTILFNDTQLRMKDKLVLLFEEELERRHGKAFKTSSPVTRLVGELFHVQNRIFIVNSRKDVVENFSICLKHYLRHGERKPRRT